MSHGEEREARSVALEKAYVHQVNTSQTIHLVVVVVVVVVWRGFGGQELIPTHRKSSCGCTSTEAFCASHRKEIEHSHYPHTSVHAR
jgi:uncharacterized Fe-S center protein